MEGSKLLEVDGTEIQPISLRFYEELVEIELNNCDSNHVFPQKSVPRHALSQNNVALGYFKVTRAKALSNGKTSLFTLHRQ
ncbi:MULTISPECIES: hypothetical protein [Alteromonas]|jgi:hypothetical protein|uniref:Uncharacterized protein n=1 Tax=Alteromonas stellipolaris TaxID=233316 RepID=A0AAW7Z4G3_9ALTE|nr:MULTISPECIES: hypothetical protein [Alteromonas]AMJ85637.1 hypothetical protein AV939_02965 [Alteromonas sp. Mac1]MDO6536903.1 hypothetical protein [Alteromonas stellipolaris]MDO6577082.1 hypothetical protein [Alteromonas stellipolaris]MDO6628268.1 hypothetical protein [Alteromonas stellipolaris]MDP2596564.1 hypothetical protein [Alteromonas stellipolaris]